MQARVQALAIARSDFRDDDTGQLKASALHLLDIPELKSCNILTRDTVLPAPSKADKALVQFLKDKQHAKVRHHLFGVVTWTLAAVGTGLIAGGLFFPPLMIAGVVVVCVAAALKMVEVFNVDKRVYNTIAKNKLDIKSDNLIVNALAWRQRRKQVYKEQQDQIGNVPKKTRKGKELDDETRTKIHLAYQLCKGRHFESNKYVSEREFTEHVMGLSWWKRRTILNSAMDKHIEQTVLLEANDYTKDFTKAGVSHFKNLG